MKTILLALLGSSAAFAQTPSSGSLIPVPAARPPEPAAPVQPDPDPKPRLIPADTTVPDWQARLELARILSYLKRYDESLADYAKVITARPDDSAIRLERARVLFWAGRSAEALPAFEEVPPASLDSESRLALADLYIAGNKFDRAEPLLRAHLKDHPDDPVTSFKLAELLSWTKRYDESLALYRRLLAARPGDVQLRRRFAYVLLWSGDFEASAAELKLTLPE